MILSMTMIVLALLALYAGLSAVIARRAEERFSRHARLPMQWWLDGRPTWYLRRRAALILIPVLTGAPLLVSAVIVVFAPDLPSDVPAGQETPFLLGMGAFGLGLYGGYVWMVGLWDRANP